MGERAGIRPQDLVGAIANEANIPSRNIHGVQVGELSSRVEVPTEAVHDVIKALHATRIRGRKVRVTIAGAEAEAAPPRRERSERSERPQRASPPPKAAPERFAPSMPEVSDDDDAPAPAAVEVEADGEEAAPLSNKWLINEELESELDEAAPPPSAPRAEKPRASAPRAKASAPRAKPSAEAAPVSVEVAKKADDRSDDVAIGKPAGRFGKPEVRGGRFGKPDDRGGRFGGKPERGSYGGKPERGSYGGKPERGSYGGKPERGSYGGKPERGGFGKPDDRGGRFGKFDKPRAGDRFGERKPGTFGAEGGPPPRPSAGRFSSDKSRAEGFKPKQRFGDRPGSSNQRSGGQSVPKRRDFGPPSGPGPGPARFSGPPKKKHGRMG
jgi:hypothetical protein